MKPEPTATDLQERLDSLERGARQIIADHPSSDTAVDLAKGAIVAVRLTRAQRRRRQWIQAIYSASEAAWLLARAANKVYDGPKVEMWLRELEEKQLGSQRGGQKSGVVRRAKNDRARRRARDLHGNLGIRQPAAISERLQNEGLVNPDTGSPFDERTIQNWLKLKK